MTEPQLDTIADFPVTTTLKTRWSDNDMFGHLNNAVYFQLFDSVINGWLAEQTGTAPLDQPARGVVAESSCRFLSEVAFPVQVTVGFRVERLGTKSVTYALGLFREDVAGPVLCTLGRWVHVYVDPVTKQTVPLTAAIRAALESVTTEPR